MSSIFRFSVGSHLAAIAVGAVAAAAYLTVFLENPQSLAATTSQRSARGRLVPRLPRRLRTWPRMLAR
jgi:hypothetical protein